MKELELQGGDSIDKCCMDLVNYSKKYNLSVFGMFNGIKVIATPESSVDELATYYIKECDIQREKYLKSPEYATEQIRRNREIKISQILLDELIDEYLLKSTTSFEILLCLVKMQPYTDHSGVFVNVDKIINHLESLGYIQNQNIGDDFNKDDLENFAHYIVGQAMDMLIRVGAIHSILLKFTQDWMNKFKDVING